MIRLVGPLSALHTMRVGIFSECYHPIRNGVVASIDALCEGLRAAGHDAIVVAPGGRVEPTPTVSLPSLPLPTRTAYRLVVPILGAQKRANVRTFSIIHTHSPFVTGWMGARYARRFSVPLVFTYHTQLEEYAHYVPFEQNTTRRAASTLTRKYANLADTVIVPTAAMEARLRSLGVTAPIAVVPSSIDVGRFAGGKRDPEWRSALGAGPDGRVVLLVSRLAREKNIELAFAALAAMGDQSVHLVLAGDGPERESLMEAARAAGIGRRTHFIGHVPRESLPDVYASADAFVFTSRTETQGLVLAEALVAGLPVVAVDSPVTREMLAGSGRLVPDDAASVASGLQELLRAPGSQSAAHLAQNRFSLEVHARRIVEVYQTLLEQRRTA